MSFLGKKIERVAAQRERGPEPRAIRSIIGVIGQLSFRWLDRKYPFRKKAVKRLVDRSYFSECMANELLDSLFRELTQTKLLGLLKSELGDPRVLDEFRYSPLTRQWQRARGPRVITHIFSGNVPNPAIVSFVLGMLVKSFNLGKVSSRDEGILDIYLESLKTVDKQLASTNLLFDPADKKLLRDAIQRSGLVVVYGSDDSLKEIREMVPASAAFVGYGHKVSFGLYTQDALRIKNLRPMAERTARDMWITDQRGCLSPMEVFIEKGGEVSASQFSESLAGAIGRVFGAKAWRLAGPAKYIVGIGGRKMVKVRAVKGIAEVSKTLSPIGKNLQAVSLEAGRLAGQRTCIAETLSRLGVNRICRAGHMQHPPLTWHHDGKSNLASWVTWTDLEG